jgi:hypothetical protein
MSRWCFFNLRRSSLGVQFRSPQDKKRCHVCERTPLSAGTCVYWTLIDFGHRGQELFTSVPVVVVKGVVEEDSTHHDLAVIVNLGKAKIHGLGGHWIAIIMRHTAVRHLSLV